MFGAYSPGYSPFLQSERFTARKSLSSCSVKVGSFNGIKRQKPVKFSGIAGGRRFQYGSPVVVNDSCEPSYSLFDEPLDEDLGWRNDFDKCYAERASLGAGSFGSVLSGVNLIEGNQVAIKVLSKNRAKSTRERTLEKVAKEVEVLERLQDIPGVIKLVDCFEDASNIRVVMELCTGGDLQSLSERKFHFNECRLALVAQEVLGILCMCHSRGLMHGDVKPANFCIKDALINPLEKPGVAQRSWLRAIDFGSSQHLPGLRRLNKRTGTPVYMAPEIYRKSYHLEADIWSLGVMLYQLFARRFPFWASEEECRKCNLEEVAMAVLEGDIPYDYGPWVEMSTDGLDFIQGCLNRNVQKRMTVDQALRHPWLLRHTADEKLLRSGNNIVRTPALSSSLLRCESVSRSPCEASCVDA